MRLIITQTEVEYWNTKGEVYVYPADTSTVNGVLSLASMFGLTPQHYPNRVIFTEFYS